MSMLSEKRVESMTASELEWLVAVMLDEYLTAPELKDLCATRGFPAAGPSKREWAAVAKARFLEPTGLREAMAKLDPTWVKVMHRLAVSPSPVRLRLLRPFLEPDSSYTGDYRVLWRRVTAGLLSRGVVLAVDGGADPWVDSRFGRFHLLVPPSFSSYLPPFPIEAMKVSGRGHTGRLSHSLSAAIEAFTSMSLTGNKPGSTWAGRMASQLQLNAGILTLSQVEHPTLEAISRTVERIWYQSLVPQKAGTNSRDPKQGNDAGMVTHYVLRHLQPEAACSARALAKSIVPFGMTVTPADITAFCDVGVELGLLERFGTGGESLFRTSSEASSVTGSVEFGSELGGAFVAARTASLLPLLQVATVSRTTIKPGGFLFEPDPIRAGRSWHELPHQLQAGLRAASKAFDETAGLLEARSGQVIVHRGLSILCVEDAGLRALLLLRFPTAVRALEGEYISCLAGAVDELVAFAKKEGFVSRRFS
ncbi:MAG: hypothetical protein HY791_08150 [Deltaproteobacteria bacterium]|nr:hypothetical protein [Deltaproteobacteria bacterium]